MEFECKYQYLLHLSVMSYMNFMEPEAVAQHTRNRSPNKSKFIKKSSTC